MGELNLFASLSGPAVSRLAALPAAVKGLEVRADRVGELAPASLRRHFSGQLLYSLRSRSQGGSFEGTLQERHRRLMAAAEGFDLIELESEHDLVSELLDRIPPRQRLISWRGASARLEDLKARFEQLSRYAAKWYAIIPAVARAVDALAPLQLLRGLGRSDLVAFAAGEAGRWTRVLSAWMGAPLAFGGQEGEEAGQLTVEQLLQDYGLHRPRPVHSLFGIVGRAVSRSLSPRLHNRAYQALGIEALYLPFHVEQFSDFWSDTLLQGLEALGLPLQGLTITSPHKEAALAVAESVSPLVRRSGAANALVRRAEGWRAESTDADGVLAPLDARGIRIEGRRVAVVGCGGAGRAAAAGLQQAGASVTLVNRGWERGQYAARLLDLPFVPLSEFSARDFALIINATPNRGSYDDSLFAVEHLSQGTVVLDYVYGTQPTQLVAASLARGHLTIDGWEILLAEVHRQFQFMTGCRMPSACVPLDVEVTS
jgi:3-dehydroquinate dehydratase/shikimate dehydrogenase